VVKTFLGSDGRAPCGDLALSGSTLYGTTAAGGANNQGTVFKINTDGSGFAVLHSFTSSDPGPHGVIVSGGTLYGVTASTVFKIDISSSAFTTLCTVDSPTPVTISGSTLYGSTQYDGDYGSGSVYKINTDGTGFTVLKSFLVDDWGGYPSAGV